MNKENTKTTAESTRNISLPYLKFSNWFSWDKRNDYSLKKCSGVYLISITPKDDLEGTTIFWNDVVYIGMTNSQKGLYGRWNQFFNAIKGKNKHSGGKSVYKDKKHYENWTDHLYVAAMGLKCNVKNPTDQDYIKMGWVAYWEYESFALYYEKVGGHPKYNKK